MKILHLQNRNLALTILFIVLGSVSSLFAQEYLSGNLAVEWEKGLERWMKFRDEEPEESLNFWGIDSIQELRTKTDSELRDLLAKKTLYSKKDIFFVTVLQFEENVSKKRQVLEKIKKHQDWEKLPEIFKYLIEKNADKFLKIVKEGLFVHVSFEGCDSYDDKPQIEILRYTNTEPEALFESDYIYIFKHEPRPCVNGPHKQPEENSSIVIRPRRVGAVLEWINPIKKTPAINPKTKRPYVFVRAGRGFRALTEKQRKYLLTLLDVINENIHYMGNTPFPEIDYKKAEEGFYLGKAFQVPTLVKWKTRGNDPVLPFVLGGASLYPFPEENYLRWKIQCRLGIPFYNVQEILTNDCHMRDCQTCWMHGPYEIGEVEAYYKKYGLYFRNLYIQCFYGDVYGSVRSRLVTTLQLAMRDSIEEMKRDLAQEVKENSQDKLLYPILQQVEKETLKYLNAMLKVTSYYDFYKWEKNPPIPYTLLNPKVDYSKYKPRSYR